MDPCKDIKRLLAAVAVESSEEGMRSALSQLTAALKPLLEPAGSAYGRTCDEHAAPSAAAAAQSLLGGDGAKAFDNVWSFGNPDLERDLLHLLSEVAVMADRAQIPVGESAQLLQLCTRRLNTGSASARNEAAGLLGSLVCAGHGSSTGADALRLLLGDAATWEVSAKVRATLLQAGAAVLKRRAEVWDCCSAEDREAIVNGVLASLDSAAEIQEAERQRSDGALPSERDTSAANLWAAAARSALAVMAVGGGRSCWAPLLHALTTTLPDTDATKGGCREAQALLLLRAGAGLVRLKGAVQPIFREEPARELPPDAFPGEMALTALVRVACGFLSSSTHSLPHARKLIQAAARLGDVPISSLVEALLSDAADCGEAGSSEAQLLQGCTLALQASRDRPGGRVFTGSSSSTGVSAILVLSEGLARRCRPAEAAFCDVGGTPVQRATPQGSAGARSELRLSCTRLEALTAVVEELAVPGAQAGLGGASPYSFVVVATLAALPFCRHPELPFAWCSEDTGRAAEALLKALAVLMGTVPPRHPVLDRAGGVGSNRQGSPHIPAFLLGLLSKVALAARDVVVQKHPHMEEEPTVKPYMGPNVFDRSVAAFQLAVCLHYLTYPLLNGALECGVLPVCLAACEDPSPTVQRIGHSMLTRLANEGLPAELREHNAILLEVTARCVTTADKDTWLTAATTAVCVTTAVEGAFPQAPGYARLMGIMLDAGELNAAYHERSLAFLSAVPPLVAAMKLQCVMYFSRLMPLLLEWLHAPMEDLHRKAAECIRSVMAVTWPRIPAHGTTLFKHFLKAYDFASTHGWDLKPLQDAAGMLLHICGPDLSTVLDGCADLPGAAGDLVRQLMEANVHSPKETNRAGDPLRFETAQSAAP